MQVRHGAGDAPMGLARRILRTFYGSGQHGAGKAAPRGTFRLDAARGRKGQSVWRCSCAGRPVLQHNFQNATIWRKQETRRAFLAFSKLSSSTAPIEEAVVTILMRI